MSNTYTWQVTKLFCYPQVENQDNVVFVAEWSLTGNDGNGHSATVFGKQQLNYEAGTSFTPYNELTESQVIIWIQKAMGAETVANYEAGIDNLIQDQITPAVIEPALPWATV